MYQLDELHVLLSLVSRLVSGKTKLAQIHVYYINQILG